MPPPPKKARPRSHKRRPGSISRLRGGLTTAKIVTVVDAEGRLIALKLTADQARDGRSAGGHAEKHRQWQYPARRSRYDSDARVDNFLASVQVASLFGTILALQSGGKVLTALRSPIPSEWGVRFLPVEALLREVEQRGPLWSSSSLPKRKRPLVSINLIELMV